LQCNIRIIGIAPLLLQTAAAPSSTGMDMALHQTIIIIYLILSCVVGVLEFCLALPGFESVLQM
jgi:hypothetical protein